MANMIGRQIGQVMVICLMAAVSTSSSALRDSRSIADGLQHRSNDGDNKLPMKQAYTYVSEYKRLPVYNFGIGKRWANGNGIKGAQPYSFGFGKRSIVDGVYPEDNMQYTNYNDEMNNDVLINAGAQKKRVGRLRYDFGLGKRSAPLQFHSTNIADNHDEIDGLKKHLNDDLQQRFYYDLSNRFVNNQDELQEDD